MHCIDHNSSPDIFHPRPSRPRSGEPIGRFEDLRHRLQLSAELWGPTLKIAPREWLQRGSLLRRPICSLRDDSSAEVLLPVLSFQLSQNPPRLFNGYLRRLGSLLFFSRRTDFFLRTSRGSPSRRRRRRPKAFLLVVGFTTRRRRRSSTQGLPWDVLKSGLTSTTDFGLIVSSTLPYPAPDTMIPSLNAGGAELNRR